MFNKKPKKYKLLAKEEVLNAYGVPSEMRRIQALVDIPMHGVKAGDIGGYVSLNNNLSHEGNCWVGGDAQLHGFNDYTKVTGNALITENAMVYSTVHGNAVIRGNAIVHGQVHGKCDISGNVVIQDGNITGNTKLSGNLNLNGTVISAAEGATVVIDGDISIENDSSKRYDDYGREVKRLTIHAKEGEAIKLAGTLDIKNISIAGNCLIEGTGIRLDGIGLEGDNIITGKPRILPNAKLSGTNRVSGDAVIPPSSHLHDVTIDTGIFSYLGTFNEPSVNPNQKSLTVESNEYIETINEIEADYESYTTDIVKLIKYPGMVDSSIPEVADFVVTLRMAKRAIKSSHEDKIEELAGKLELSFVRAENKVRTLVSSRLDESQKKSLKTAEKMFKIACDDASPEPEKRLGFKAGLKSLEGVLDVSEKAVENLKERVGILELEA